MNKPEQLVVYAVGLLIVLVALYLIWPYVIGFLAIVGAHQLYRAWRQYRQ